MIYNRTQMICHTPDGREVLFDSEQEGNYYLHLLELEKQGKITNIIIKPQFVLAHPFIYFGHKEQGTVYTPDFAYQVVDTKQWIYIEVKGMITPEFELRLKWWKYLNQDKKIIVVAYSKKTGWLELSEYKKARRKIKKEEMETRVAKRQEEERIKAENREKRHQEHLEIVKRELADTERKIADLEKKGFCNLTDNQVVRLQNLYVKRDNYKSELGE